METSQLEQLLSDQWRRTVNSCCSSLESDDLRQVIVNNTWDDLRWLLLKSEDGDASGHREFALLVPAVTNLKRFANIWIQQSIPNGDTSVFCGLLRLVVMLSQGEKTASARIPQMLREICHKIEILNSYCGDAQTLTNQLKEACTESALALMKFFTYVVKFIRSDTIHYAPGHSHDSEWQPVEQQFTSTAREIDDYVSRREKLSKFADRYSRTEDVLRRHPSMSGTSSRPPTSQPDEIAKLPCVVLPNIRTTKFFDRADVIEKMDEHFNKVDPDQSFRSLAIHGLGGVGKSSIALRFAEAKLRRGELDALFWISSEKLNNIRSSFTEIAMQLRLPHARPGDEEENHALVLNWLQHTHCRWLIVYDNAEDLDLIRDHWPLASRGQALITTRNHYFAFEPADGGLELTAWDDETGSRFLLHLLSTDIVTQLEEDEVTSARELSQKLSGHALAISHIAGMIHRRSWSIAEFMKIYDQYPEKTHGFFGSRSINALWDFSFKSLDPHSSAILGVLSFLNPDSIPQALFEPPSASDLPKSLRFCSDPLVFSDVIENLLTIALLKRGRDSRTFAIHRLVQTSYKSFMTPEQRQQSFNDASILLSQAFPRKNKDTAQLYLLWSLCGAYRPHVINLKDCFLEEKKSNPKFYALQTYCDMNNACQRYLLEINAYTDLASLIEVNSMVFESLPPEHQTINLQGSLTSHRGQLLVRLGKPVEGVEWLRKSYEIRSGEIPLNLQEQAWAMENAANGIATLNEFDEAIEWYINARGWWLQWQEKQPTNRDEWPAVIKKSMAMALIWAGQADRARELAMLALEQIESTKPYNWAMAAYTHFALGTIDRHDRNFEPAEAHFMEAQNLWIKGDQLRTDPFNAACMHRLGCTALDQGKLEAAIKHLRDAIAITNMHKDNMAAEHARCLFKLSEALEQEPREGAEAGRLREEAEHLLLQCSPGLKDTGHERTYDSVINILWR